MSSTAPPPEPADDWLALIPAALPLGSVSSWLVQPGCGAMVQFTGTTRDTSGGRSGVELLTYEAYDSEVTRRMAAVATEMRGRWADVERIAILHRSGEVAVGEASVHVGVSAPHRDDAFEAARFGIDAVKASVPIWKLERHSGGEDWGLDGSDIADASDVASSWNRSPTVEPSIDRTASPESVT